MAVGVPVLDCSLGLEAYATTTAGIGGAIKRGAEDFVVEEVLVDGSKASATPEEVAGKPPLGASERQTRFLLCSLVKRNWDMFMAVKNVASQLGVESGRVQFAGIKDAKALTAQYVTVEGATFESAGKVNVKDLTLTPLGYFREALSTFYLLGNNFRITIQEPTLTAAEAQQQITKTIEQLQDVGGIPNFYGHQRFGTTRPITHLVGKAIVQGDLEQAALLFLAKPSPHEHPSSREARAALQETQDFQRALQDFPRQLRYERYMLEHLAQSPGDFVGAFRRLPLKLRMLFVQAYQSLLFNRFLSARLKQGLALNKAAVGDYVVNVERTGLAMVKTGKIVAESQIAQVNEQIAAGKMRVALPVVGFSQKLSQGEIGQTQQRIMAEEGIDRQSFHMQQLPEINARGELRAAACPIQNFQHLNNPAQSPQVEFMLQKGSYATVLLREIIKPQDLVAAGF
ncbi:MAG: tRNA pseudouridine(13) synthase TruD [Candidatus Bathyarchaeota archaeon]|nr:tRNA pseudouridine(13) synthase TruD [Candidatus Bathyarchaeota archaeon]